MDDHLIDDHSSALQFQFREGFIHCHRTWDYTLSFCDTTDSFQGHLIASELLIVSSRAQFRTETRSLGKFNFNFQNSNRMQGQKEEGNFATA